MKNQLVKVYQGVITEDEEDISLPQLCSHCQLEPEEVFELVNEGILAPVGRSNYTWRFRFTTIERVKKVRRLQRDFELNLSGTALAIHLLDKIEELEAISRQTVGKSNLL
jgi:chaperone modulatory protein CbpM